MQQHQKKTSSMESVHSLMLTNNNGRVGRSGSDGLLPRYSTEHNNAAMLLSSSPSSPTNTITTTNYNNNNNNGNHHSSASSSGGSRFARLLAPLLSNNKSKNQQQQQQQSATLSPTTTTTTTPLSLSTSPPQSHHAAQLKHMDSFDMTLMNRSMFYQQSLHNNNNNNNGSNSNSTTGNNHANNHPSSSLQLQVNHPNTNTNHNVKRSSMVYTYPSTLLSPSSATPTTPVATLNTLTSPTSPTTTTNTAVNHRNSLNHSQIVISQPQNHHNHNHNHHHHHHLPSKSVSMDKPISNIEEEFDTRVRITCHICRNLLNKRGKLYVKLIDWKSYVLMNVSLDEMGGVMIRTVSESGVLSDETIVSHCKMLPTQHFSVNHRGRLPIQVSKEPLVKSAMTAKDRRKDHGTMNKVDKERVVCNVFSFILENHETNVSEQQEEREESENSSFLQSILFACADDAELEDWNQLFDLITMRNMALFNISSRINRKECNLLYRPRECLRQQIMDEMNLVVNSGMEDVVGLDQLLSLYTEEINV